MQKNLKMAVMPFAVMTALSIASVTPAFAKTINTIRLEVDADITAGTDIGTESINVTSSTDGIDIDNVEISSYGIPDQKKTTTSTTSSDDDDDTDISSDDDDDELYTGEDGTWHSNYKPVITVTLKRIDDDDKLSANKASDFKLSGTGDPVYVSSSGGTSKTEVKIRLRALQTGSTVIDNAKFGKNATDGCYVDIGDTTDDIYYKIKLYRDNTLQNTYTTEKGVKSFDLTPYITKTGSYRVQMRIYNVTTGTKSGYADVGTNIEITDNDLEDFKKLSYARPAIQYENMASVSGTWQQNDKGWWWQNTDGTYPTNAWRYINNAWYYFNADGYAVTGDQEINGNKFTFDNTSCYMLSGWVYNTKDTAWYYYGTEYGDKKYGWQKIDGEWYYLDPTTGKMATGYIDIGADKYYLRSSGKMLSNAAAPDGKYYCTANGTCVPAN